MNEKYMKKTLQDYKNMKLVDCEKPIEDNNSDILLLILSELKEINNKLNIVTRSQEKK